MKRYIAIFVLLLFVIGLVGLLGYTCSKLIQKDKQITNLNIQIEELNDTVKELNNRIEILQDEQVEINGVS